MRIRIRRMGKMLPTLVFDFFHPLKKIRNIDLNGSKRLLDLPKLLLLIVRDHRPCDDTHPQHKETAHQNNHRFHGISSPVARTLTKDRDGPPECPGKTCASKRLPIAH